jgi:hypothetical protein
MYAPEPCSQGLYPREGERERVWAQNVVPTVDWSAYSGLAGSMKIPAEKFSDTRWVVAKPTMRASLCKWTGVWKFWERVLVTLAHIGPGAVVYSDMHWFFCGSCPCLHSDLSPALPTSAGSPVAPVQKKVHSLAEGNTA